MTKGLTTNRRIEFWQGERSFSMRVVYEDTIENKILNAKLEAEKLNRKIEYIYLDKSEWGQFVVLCDTLAYITHQTCWHDYMYNKAVFLGIAIRKDF